METIITITAAKQRLPLGSIAVAFLLGELWGHAGHGIDPQHIITSAVQSALFFAIVYLLRDSKSEAK